MKIAIFGRITDNTDFGVLTDFFEYLRAEGIKYCINQSYAEAIKGHLKDWKKLVQSHTFSSQIELEDCSCVYSFGGDGTFLDTIKITGPLELPLLGVNFGRLGFLTSIMQAELKAATREIQRETYKIETRTAIVVESNPKGVFQEHNYGLNDLTIHKSRSNEMITVHTYINGEFLNSYWGDGLIIATPTGSTAYSLSCGGPIIHPTANVFVITPVAPHSLTVRPVIIPDNYVVSFEIESRAGQAMVAMDTRTELVKARTEIAIRKADFKVKLIRMSNGNYLNALRDRLKWGVDYRN